jgi:hypothetical protein
VPRFLKHLFALAFLPATVSAAAEQVPPSLKDVIASGLETEPGCGEPGLFSSRMIELGGISAWIVAHPLFCYEDGQPGSGYYIWEPGGTSGPSVGVFLPSDDTWRRVGSWRAHDVRPVAPDIIEVVVHHVACANTVKKGCVTRYLWNGTDFDIVSRNHELSEGRKTAP